MMTVDLKHKILGLSAVACVILASGCATTSGVPQTEKTESGLVSHYTVTESGGYTLLLERDINAPADKLWRILGDGFADIDQWYSLVSESRAFEGEIPEGLMVAPEAPVPGRVTVTSLATATEILTAYSNAERTFTFDALDMPFFIKVARNTTTVRESGDGAVATMLLEIELLGPFKVMNEAMAKRMTKSLGGVLEELKHYAETDTLPPAKKEALAKALR
jgi:hypothetical protein